MNTGKLPEKCTIANIEQWLTHTTVYICIVPGQEWALWKAGNYYCLQQVVPKQGEKKMDKNLTELLLWFLLGDAVQRGQYDRMPEGNVLSFAEKKVGK
jgi:hypothetical protein